LEWKLASSIVEKNNTNLTINTTKAMKTNIANGMILVQQIHKEEQE
jgi:triacylglycerol esterase/lipase EstA (alpha/beta hydrolase family)